MGAIYELGNGRNYGMPEGALRGGIIMFTSTALVCLATLFVRRKVYGGELGGPTGSKYATAAFFVLLWMTYVVVSALQTYGKITL